MASAVCYDNGALSVTVNWDNKLAITSVSWINNGPDVTVWVNGVSRVVAAGESSQRAFTGGATKMKTDGVDFWLDPTVSIRVGP